MDIDIDIDRYIFINIYMFWRDIVQGSFATESQKTSEKKKKEKNNG